MHPEKSEENSFNTWYSKHENKGHSDITFSYPYLNILMHEKKIHDTVVRTMDVPNATTFTYTSGYI